MFHPCDTYGPIPDTPGLLQSSIGEMQHANKQASRVDRATQRRPRLYGSIRVRPDGVAARTGHPSLHLGGRSTAVGRARSRRVWCSRGMDGSFAARFPRGPRLAVNRPGLGSTIAASHETRYTRKRREGLPNSRVVSLLLSTLWKPIRHGGLPLFSVVWVAKASPPPTLVHTTRPLTSDTRPTVRALNG